MELIHCVELGWTGRLSMGTFQKLLSGNTWQELIFTAVGEAAALVGANPETNNEPSKINMRTKE